MSRFFTKTLSALEPYTPGEQPQDMKYIKLNTNESPFEPSAKAKAVATEHERALNLYSDPGCKLVIDKLAEIYDVDPANLILGNFCFSHSEHFVMKTERLFFRISATASTRYLHR